MSVDELDRDHLYIKLDSQFRRLMRLMDAVVPEGYVQDPVVCIVEAYSEVQVKDAAKQVLSGWGLAKSATLCCDECGESLDVGDSVEILLRRPRGNMAWFVFKMGCKDCKLKLPETDDFIDVVASAHIDSRQHIGGDEPLPVLGDVSVEKLSGAMYQSKDNEKGGS